MPLVLFNAASVKTAWALVQAGDPGTALALVSDLPQEFYAEHLEQLHEDESLVAAADGLAEFLVKGGHVDPDLNETEFVGHMVGRA